MNDATATSNSSGEQLSKRCVALLKMALKPDVWPNCELKLAWFDRLFQTVDSPSVPVTPATVAAASQPNFTNICTALELLTFLLSILRKEQILAGFKPLQRGLASLMNSTNPKVNLGFFITNHDSNLNPLNRRFYRPLQSGSTFGKF